MKMDLELVRKLGLTLAVALPLSVLAACEKAEDAAAPAATEETVDDAAGAAQESTSDAVDQSTDAVEDAADAVEDAAEDAVDAVEDAAEVPAEAPAEGQ